MKTLKQHIAEGYKQGKYGAGNVGTPEVNSVEDGSIGVHNIHDPKVCLLYTSPSPRDLG